jgi:hypothetical protein
MERKAKRKLIYLKIKQAISRIRPLTQQRTEKNSRVIYVYLTHDGGQYVEISKDYEKGFLLSI